VFGLKHLVRLQSCENAKGWCTAQHKMLLFAQKTIVKEACSFDLASLKKKEKHFGHHSTGCVFRHESI